jgi:hypothetical protein
MKNGAIFIKTCYCNESPILPLLLNRSPTLPLVLQLMTVNEVCIIRLYVAGDMKFEFTMAGERWSCKLSCLW